MLVTASDRGDNKGQRAAHSLIKWLTFTASILYLVVLIPLNFSYDIAKIVFLIVTKSRTDTTIQCSVTTELNMQFWQGRSHYFHLHARAPPTEMPGCVDERIGSDNGLLPGWCEAIIWTNVGTLLIGLLGTHFIEILFEIWNISYKNINWKMSSAKWWPFCLVSICQILWALCLCTVT